MVHKEVNYKDIYVKPVQGRYVTYDHINPFLTKLVQQFKVEDLGVSVRGEVIQSVTYGIGAKRILMWSQMHGNESTTTKAVLDLLNYLQTENHDLYTSCTLKIIPILNPDGARDYTRVNANKIDLNRDAQDQSQPESRILKNVYKEFMPDFCFNLHDQRTIFNVGITNMPATVSFLAPAFDKERNNSPSRLLSMQVIAAMNNALQEVIPNKVGRYDDGFNANCVGDAFQMKNTPTILFEAGHFYDDYKREKTRSFIFTALLEGINAIVSNSLIDYTVKDYLAIPENGKQFVDILVQNSFHINNSIELDKVIAIQYKELLRHNEVVLQPEIHDVDLNSINYFGHRVLNCDNPQDVEWMKNNDILKLLS